MAEPPVDRPDRPGEPPEESRRGGPELSRRAFLGGAAGAAGLAALGPFGPMRLLRRARPLDDIINPIVPIGVGNGGPDLVLSVERQDDLVLLDFFFYNFSLQDGTPPTIVPNDPSNNTIVVQFPPQALAEAEYYWTQPSPGHYVLPVDPPPILSDLSGTSRLCFTTGQSIPLTTLTPTDLLDWTGWTLVVPPVAQVHGPTRLLDAAATGAASYPYPTEPTALETAIEFPYALFLSPVVYASGLPIDGFTTEFTSRPAPLVSPAGIVDLWSTALAGAPVLELIEGAAYVPPVSAVWASDYPNNPQGLSDATPEDYIDYGEPIA